MLKKGPMNKKLSLLVCALAFWCNPLWHNHLMTIATVPSKLATSLNIAARLENSPPWTLHLPVMVPVLAGAPPLVTFGLLSGAFASDVNITIIGANVAGTPGGTPSHHASCPVQRCLRRNSSGN
jgi:hypothetical protein